MGLGILEHIKIEDLMNQLWLKTLTRDEISEHLKKDFNEGKISKTETQFHYKGNLHLNPIELVTLE